MVRLSMQQGRLVTDRSAGGRGAWLCPATDCVDLAVKRRAVARALRTEVGPEALSTLRDEVVTGAVFPIDGRS